MSDREAKRSLAVAKIKQTKGYSFMRQSLQLQSNDDIPHILTPRTEADMTKQQFEDSFYLWKCYIRQFENRAAVAHG